MKTIHRLWIGVGILAILSPIGLYLPEKFKAGSAWGEWDTHELHNIVGYVPAGLKKLSALWSAVMPDYAFKGCNTMSSGQVRLSYIIAALIGIVLCVGVMYLLGKFLIGKGSGK
jgi:hypothetical protein